MPTFLLRAVFPLIFMAALPACGGRADERARKEIHAAGFAFSVDDFLRAAREGREDVVRQFLAAGMNADVANEHGVNAVASAAAGGHGHVVALLLSRGAKPNAVSPEGQTALMAAAQSGDEQAVKALLAAGADAQAADKSGMSPLAAAVLAGHSPVVALLVERAPRSLDDALKLAAINGHTAVMSVLMDRGASVLAVSADGRTPMMFAAQSGRMEAAKLLRQRGAPVTALDHDLKTPANLAEENGHEEMAAWLREPDRRSDPLEPETPPVRLPEVAWTGEVPESLGALAAAIRIVDYRSAALPFAVEEVPDGDASATVRLLGAEERVVTVAPGEEIPDAGLTVEKVRRRIISSRRGPGRLVDASEVLVRETAGGRHHLAVKGLPVLTGEGCALATIPGVEGISEVRRGDVFNAGPMPVKVIEVRPMQVVLERTDTKETATVVRDGAP